MPVGPGFPRVQPDTIRVGASVVHHQLHWWVRGCILCGAGQPHVSLPCVANPTHPFTVCMSPLPTPCSSPTTPFQSFLLDHHWAAGVLPQLRLRRATASLIQAHTMLPHLLSHLCSRGASVPRPCFASSTGTSQLRTDPRQSGLPRAAVGRQQVSNAFAYQMAHPQPGEFVSPSPTCSARGLFDRVFDDVN